MPASNNSSNTSLSCDFEKFTSFLLGFNLLICKNADNSVILELIAVWASNEKMLRRAVRDTYFLSLFFKKNLK
jgi:hypothetical protein